MKKTFTLQNFAFGLISLFATITSFGQTVTSSADDGTPGTLRSQVAAAVAGSTITFDNSVTNVVLLTGEITIDKNLTIVGNGSTTTTINGNANGRIFNVNNGNFIIRELRLTNGLADNGGAIQVVGANLVINNSLLTNNRANGVLGSGGAVMVGTGSVFASNNSTFSNNISNRAGGAVEATAGTVNTFLNVDFTGNITGAAPATPSPGNGGAFHMTGIGASTFTGGTVSNNVAAAEGGGLWNGAGTMIITGTTITANTASGVAADNGGGGIYNLNNGTLTITNATITNNIANGTAGSGGGILNDVGATVTINNSSLMAG